MRPVSMPLVLAALAVAASGCASTATTLAPNRQYLKEPTEPPALGFSAETEELAVTLETVITPGGPGSWYKEAAWDEYVLTFENRSDEPVRITSLDLVDQRGVYVATERSIQTVSSRSEALLAEYKRVGINVAAGAAVQLGAIAAYGYAGAAAAAVAPVALVAAPAYLLWRRHARAEDRDRTEVEFEARQLPPYLSLAPGGTITGSAFFPLVAGPSEVVAGYEATRKTGRVSIPLDAVTPR